MKILNETVLWGTYIFNIAVISTIGFFTAFLAFGLIYAMIKKHEFDFSSFVGACIFSIVATFCAGAVTITYKDGAETEYLAKVTDWNKVYEQGYEVVSQEGKLYVLKKTK